MWSKGDPNLNIKSSRNLIWGLWSIDCHIFVFLMILWHLCQHPCAINHQCSGQFCNWHQWKELNRSVCVYTHTLLTFLHTYIQNMHTYIKKRKHLSEKSFCGHYSNWSWIQLICNLQTLGGREWSEMRGSQALAYAYMYHGGNLHMPFCC